MTMLPPNATAQERALDESTERISDVPVPVRDMYNPAECPEVVLPWLAWSYSLDEWNSDWTEEQKRDAISLSVYVHQHKGTIGALKTALSALGYELTVEEWHQLDPPGDPYTFGIHIVVSQVGIPTAALFDQIVYVAESAKNARSHLDYVNVTALTDGDIYCGGAVSIGEVISIDAEA